ncbi:hypothetical protein F5879DRAFT_1066211 [Lentinula edodes]|nr:hypothetical protein F5879DRAFT_1066211 [Lentinula edodes]
MSQLMKHDIFKPILDLTLQESRRDNLLSCSCQEFLEHMRRMYLLQENMKDQINFCMTKHEVEIKTLAETRLGGQRFQLFIRRWEMNNEPMPVEAKPEKIFDTRNWPIGSRVVEAEEEDYFNGDDEDDFVPAISHSWSRGTGASSPVPSSNGLKRKRRMAVVEALTNKGIRTHRPPPRSPHLGSLVDYKDDEELVSIDTSEDPSASSSSSTLAPPSSPQPSHRQIPLPRTAPHSNACPRWTHEPGRMNMIKKRTFNQKVPRSLLNKGPSISNSFAPAATLVLKFPTKSSIGGPKSLSKTYTSKSDVIGTFLTRHVSFQTGVRVFVFTVELRWCGQLSPVV